MIESLPLLTRQRALRPPCAQTQRGYHVAYRRGETNHCPGCGRSHWLVGRLSAECAFCATALPLAEAVATSHPMPVIRHKRGTVEQAWAA